MHTCSDFDAKVESLLKAVPHNERRAGRLMCMSQRLVFTYAARSFANFPSIN
jgi:hypothetical protein